MFIAGLFHYRVYVELQHQMRFMFLEWLTSFCFSGDPVEILFAGTGNMTGFYGLAKSIWSLAREKNASFML